MSSILTNNSAMVALQTLKSINKNLAMTQNEISTGKSISSAKDNSAVWAISKVMESDVAGFKAISESLSLGESTVAVARNASETTTDLLTQIKEKVVAAQEENVDRTKIQEDIDALVGQVGSVTGAAQFNGLNLVAGAESVSVLSSLDRGENGSVASNSITIERQDLTSNAGTLGTGASLVGGTALTAGDTDVSGGAVTVVSGANRVADDSSTQDFSSSGNAMNITFAGTAATSDVYTLNIGDSQVDFTVGATTTAAAVASGLQAQIAGAGIDNITASVTGGVLTITSTEAFDTTSISGQTTGAGTLQADLPNAAAGAAGTSFSAVELQGRASEVTFAQNTSVAAGDGYRVSIGGANFDYVASAGETAEDVAKGLKTAIDAGGLDDITTNVKFENNQWTLQLDNSGSAIALEVDGAAGGTATGGLFGLDRIDVTTDQGVSDALSNIETMIDTSIDAAAAFGSAQGRIETQSDFISQLTDSLKSGIGSLVDADMEEVSARLQALQTQQQLGVQSLSIANQAPQTILSLFR
ncbi:MAG: flagellin [Pseudomonadota bacterium]